MKKTPLYGALTSALFCLTVQAEPVWISVESQVLQALPEVAVLQRQPVLLGEAVLQSGHQQPVLVQVDSADLAVLSEYIHAEQHRCGGYIAYDSLEQALQALTQPLLAASFTAPPLTQGTLVNSQLPQLNQANIAQFISDLSQFTNRYYTTNAGVQAADWIATQWQNLSNNHSWIKVSRISHSGYPQRSVLLEMSGSEKPNDIVVLGGHLDSINSGGTSETTRAPGADDDASGIATLSEIIRVLSSAGLRPKRTIRFYGYAAEEVGLRGSRDIATAAANSAQNIIAAMQLDMTNFKGSAEDIVLMTDYTNANLNGYLQKLISTYQPALRQSTDVCGYGCSDHASWHNAGFAASMPFEARFAGSNKKIHTSNDTLANSDPTALHALKFARLGLSFVLELGNAVGGTPGGTSGSFPNLAATTGNWVYKTLVLPAGQSQLNINMSGGTGDADLYLRLGSNPTTSSYQCRPYKTGNNENCVITNPSAGSWVVGVRAYSSFSGVNVNWQSN